MKRFFALAALLLGLAACQTEPEGLDVNVGGAVDTTITVAIPEGTRASSADGFNLSTLASTNYSLRYILEVYRVNDDTVLYDTCQRFVETSKNTSMVFPVRLAPGYDYRIVAWTDIVEGDSKEDRYYYTEEGLDNVVIKDNGTVNWNAMDETRDAYTYVKVVDNFSSASNLDMTLTRPFAKLRVVATDIDDIRRVGLVPTTATVEYSQDMYFKYNAVADIENKGAANDARAKSHTFTYTTTATQYVDNNGEYTLFTDYIFVPSTGTAKFNLTVKDADGNIINKEIGSFNTEISVQRNKLTTIKGDVLTVGGNVKVEVDNGLGELKTINYADNAETLQEIINAAPADGEQTNITLGGNIDLDDLLNAGILSTRASEPTYGLLISEGQSIVLDLNGHTISQSKKCASVYSMIVNKGTLTITDSSENGTGKISFQDTGAGDPDFGWGSYTLTNEGTLVIENGTIENTTSLNTNNDVIHMYCAIQQANGSTTIKGGNISNNTYRSIRVNRGTLTIEGGNFNGQIWMQPFAENSSIAISGGKFQPSGADGSSIFVTNNEKHVALTVTGGEFMTKIGCSDATKLEGVITGGTFTTAAKENTAIALLDSDYEFVADGDNWTVGRKADVAMIGDVGYTSLAKAIAAVEDGGTITLVANEVFTETNRYNNGGWWDGLGYSGDKSFTIDLNSKTICQKDEALNDYLIWIKNDGSKANTITLKNGTLDAGTTAYCAFATASSNKQKITINLENVNLIGNNSSGAVAKIRGGAELNVKAGTVITGKNNYVGIECVGSATVVNIYEGAKIYQNGTTSYCGSLAGVSYGSTLNVYGGEGTSKKGGFIAMTSGGTINISGGEWIANADGTYANGNDSVLIAQSDKNTYAGAGNSVINVTGGTFKGGYNCYGNAVGDAQINIKGGNFNANPSSYLAEGCEATENNGVWNVRVLPVAQIGETEYDTLQEAFNVGGNITLLRNVTVAETVTLAEGKTAVLNLNGKTLTHADEANKYALNNLGTLTITGNGTINARGIYNGYGNGGENVATAKLTIENGAFNAKGTNGGAAVYNYGTVEINGGKFESNGGYGLNNQAGSMLTITGGEIRGGIYNCGTLSIGGENTSVYQHLSGKHAIYNWSATATINNGAFDSVSGNELILADGQDSSVTINGGTFDKTGKSWLMGAAVGKNITFVVNGGTFRGYVNMPEMTVDTFRPYNDPIVVCGGTFNFDPAKWMSDDYTATKDAENNTWTVVRK